MKKFCAANAIQNWAKAVLNCAKAVLNTASANAIQLLC